MLIAQKAAIGQGFIVITIQCVFNMNMLIHAYISLTKGTIFIYTYQNLHAEYNTFALVLHSMIFLLNYTETVN